MIRVLIADRSAHRRRVLVDLLHRDPYVQVLAQAKDADEVLEMTRRLSPSLLLIDAEIEPSGALTRRLVEETPLPIVLLIADEALAKNAQGAGEVAVVARVEDERGPAAARLLETVRVMAGVKVIRRRGSRARVLERTPTPVGPGSAGSRATEPAGPGPVRAIAIAASTGGPAALRTILSELPMELPVPILVAQHIADGFISALIDALAPKTRLPLRLAEDGATLEPGTVYFAPDGFHLGATETGRVALIDSEPVGGFRPSATVLFDVMARVFGSAAIGVILSGMGSDGVDGLRSLKNAGGTVLAQDEESSLIFGMPGAAVAEGLADATLPLEAIAGRLVEIVESRKLDRARAS